MRHVEAAQLMSAERRQWSTIASEKLSLTTTANRADLAMASMRLTRLTPADHREVEAVAAPTLP